ncbi:LPD7 domain-containing protein [Acidithiobacillus sp.]
MATQAAMEESREVLEAADPAGHMGPTEKARAVPKVLKKKLTLPITGEVNLPRAVREAMEYRVDLVPLVLDEGSILARPELKPGEQPVAYEVLRKGNDLDGLNPGFPVALDRMRFDTRQDPQAAEKALQKAQELAAQKLDMDLLIPGYGKATPENQEKLLKSAFRDALDGWKAPAKASEPSQEPEPARPEPKSREPDNAELVQDWPKTQRTPPAKARQVFERHAPEPLLAHKNRPLVLDYGDHITVTRRAMLGIGTSARQRREQAVSTALQAAVQRFGEPVHFEGNPQFLRETAAMAVKLGISLEPGSKLAGEVYREAQEKAARVRGNTLGPARKAPEPQRTLQQDRGLER